MSFKKGLKNRFPALRQVFNCLSKKKYFFLVFRLQNEKIKKKYISKNLNYFVYKNMKASKKA